MAEEKRKAPVKVEPKKEESKAPAKKANYVINQKNALFMLGVTNIALACAFLLIFVIAAIVNLASTGAYTILGIIMQTVSVLLLVVFALLNYREIKAKLDRGLTKQYAIGELIVALFITLTLILGFGSWFVIFAGLSIVIISAIKLWLASVK